MLQVDHVHVSKSEEAQLPSVKVGFARTLAVLALTTSLVACSHNRIKDLQPISSPQPQEDKSCCSTQKSCEVPTDLKPTDLLVSDQNIKISRSANPPSLDDTVIIPAKKVIMGGGREDTTPAREVEVPSFRISKTETTNKEFARFVKETGYITEAELPWQDSPNGPLLEPASFVFVAPDHYDESKSSAQWSRLVKGANWRNPEGPGSNLEGREDYPVVHVTIKDAMAYAKWAGRELPTEAQFRATATIGDLVQPNVEEPSVLQVNFYQGNFPVKDLGLDQYKGLAPVGAFPANGNGVFEIIGNGWELTRSYYDDTKQYVVIAGGSFLCSWEGGFTCTNASSSGRTSHSLKSSANHVTFRTVTSETE